MNETITKPLVVAYGGGVNSTAMLVEFYQRGIKPDLVLFADTGGERPETYDCVKKVSLWCMERGMAGIHTVHGTYQGKFESLEDNCIRNKMLPSIAYGYKKCSLKHKVQPQDRFVNNWDVAQKAWNGGLKVIKAIGYDAGESRRGVIRADDKYDYWYPLIDWDIYREDCVEICKSEGLPTAKSSCFFCPSMKKKEIFDLKKNHPDLLERALRMESNANLTSIKGLGRSYAWRDLIANDEAQLRLFDDYSAPEVPCGCYDG